MIPPNLEEKVRDLFLNHYKRLDEESKKSVLEIYYFVNHYLLLREESLQRIYNQIKENEAMWSYFFDLIPSILFHLQQQGVLNDAIDDIANSFCFWGNPKDTEVPLTADLAVVEGTFYQLEYVKTKLKQEKWIFILCLFFLYFPSNLLKG